VDIAGWDAPREILVQEIGGLHPGFVLPRAMSPPAEGMAGMLALKRSASRIHGHEARDLAGEAALIWILILTRKRSTRPARHGFRGAMRPD
jgi:hypothetical protein